MFSKILVLLLVCIFIQNSSGVNEDDLIVKLVKPVGKIRGHVLESAKGRVYYAFQDIPYGKSPVGENRFRPPEFHDDWDGILNCTKNTKICYQFMNPMNEIDVVRQYLETGKTHEVEESEDCLYLNVYTPVKPGRNESLSVYLFIHGGAFAVGDGTFARNGPKYLIDGDIVIVTMNYRLGALGFLSTGDTEISGNMGLKDQNLALEWTHKNIHLFGGNPKDIILGGNSAGAHAVGYHLSSPRTKEEEYSYQPMITTPMHQGMMQGNFNQVPSFIGFTSEESLAFMTPDESQLKRAAALYDANPSMLINSVLDVENRTLAGGKLKALYTASSFEDDLDSFIRFTSDANFVRSSVRQAEVTSKYVPVYLYELSAVNNKKEKYPGVPHSSEMQYLWERTTNPRVAVPVDEEVREIVLRLWWNFIKYKNPTPEKDPILQNIEWPKVEPGNIRFLNLNKSMSIKTNPKNYNNVRDVLLKYMESPFYVF